MINRSLHFLGFIISLVRNNAEHFSTNYGGHLQRHFCSARLNDRIDREMIIEYSQKLKPITYCEPPKRL